MTQFKGKAIYNPSGKAGEYSYWACNFYVGCSNGCQYCYLKKGIGKAVLGGDKPTLKKCFRDEKEAIEVFKKELYQNISELREYGLFFSFTTDPMLPETFLLTRNAINICQKNNIPVKILTKIGGTPLDELITFEARENYWQKDLIAFGFTLTGHDELESGASTNAERIEAMRQLYAAGFKTWASIEPVIDCSSSYEMIAKTIGFCNLYKIGLQSGKIYKNKEIELFIDSIGELEPQRPIYLKNSIFRYCNYSRETIEQTAGNFVGKDYNIFKQ